MSQEEKKRDPSLWTHQDETQAMLIRQKYLDREAHAKEWSDKRKAAEKMPKDAPSYARAVISAELAEMRMEMAYIVADYGRLRGYIESISWLHQQVNILEGCYSHQKMLAEKCRIDYALIESGLKQIIKLKEELSNANTTGSTETAGQQSQLLQVKT